MMMNVLLVCDFQIGLRAYHSLRINLEEYFCEFRKSFDPIEMPISILRSEEVSLSIGKKCCEIFCHRKRNNRIILRVPDMYAVSERLE